MNKTEEFIEKAIQIHGDKYDYSKVVYENNLKEVSEHLEDSEDDSHSYLNLLQLNYKINNNQG